MWIMKSMYSPGRLTTTLLVGVLVSLLQLERTEAQVHVAFPPYSPSVQLRARTIAGTVTLNGEPLDGTAVSLHRFLGAYSIELSHADAHVLGKATTAKDGRFSFGELSSGKYVVFVRGASVEVKLIKPKSGENDTIAIENFADSCVRGTVVSADGRILMRAPTSPCY